MQLQRSQSAPQPALLEGIPRIARKSLTRSAIAAYGCICVALALLLGVSIWSTYRELQLYRAALLQSEVARLRSHAERTVGRLEREMESRSEFDLGAVGEKDWLREYWQRVIPHEEERLYAAIVDRTGTVLHHSKSELIGKQLSRQWYDRLASEAGDWVVETRSIALTDGEEALDVRVPIVLNDQEVGEYHAGFDTAWFDRWTASHEGVFLRRRTLLVGAVLIIVLLAATSLYYIATHSVFLRRAVNSAQLERTAEISQLAAGLAHEIRNPLHAIRLNLHTFGRSQGNESTLDPDELRSMLDQSNREIERIDRLMQELVSFATPEHPRDELIDLKAELKGVVDFIDQEMIRNDVEVETQLPAQPVFVRIDSGRLRQILLNLLHNAAEASSSGGKIVVAVGARSGVVELSVADNGHGISDEDRTRIFEPFFTTKSDGTGLGLALVKRFVDEADGEIHCEQNPGGGTIFRIRLENQTNTRK